MRVKAILSYDGSFFQGFQKQKRTPNTITTVLESALRSLNIQGDIIGSGRTDAGVHATGQVIHFDLPDFWTDLSKLRQELNRKLQHVRIKHITPVDEDFHARFSAKKRLYRYLFKQKELSIFEEKYFIFYLDQFYSTFERVTIKFKKNVNNHVKEKSNLIASSFLSHLCTHK